MWQKGAPEGIPAVKACISNQSPNLTSQKLNIYAANQLFMPEINHRAPKEAAGGQEQLRHG